MNFKLTRDDFSLLIDKAKKIGIKHLFFILGYIVSKGLLISIIDSGKSLTFEINIVTFLILLLFIFIITLGLAYPFYRFVFKKERDIFSYAKNNDLSIQKSLGLSLIFISFYTIPLSILSINVMNYGLSTTASGNSFLSQIFTIVLGVPTLLIILISFDCISLIEKYKLPKTQSTRLVLPFFILYWVILAIISQIGFVTNNILRFIFGIMPLALMALLVLFYLKYILIDFPPTFDKIKNQLK